MEAEVERLENITAVGVHSCSVHCQRPMCVLRREHDALRARVEGADKYMIEPLTRVSSDGETMFYGGAIHVSNNMIGQRIALVKAEAAKNPGTRFSLLNRCGLTLTFCLSPLRPR